MVTGKSGAGKEQQTRGINRITGAEHCSKLGPTGIEKGETILVHVHIW